MALSIIYILYFSMSFDKIILGSIFFLIGIMCCYQVLVFSMGTKISSSQTLSLTIAFLNCVNMLGGAFFHTLIGKGIDLYGGSINGIYPVESYRIALLIIPICAIIGSFITLFSRNSSTSH